MFRDRRTLIFDFDGTLVDSAPDLHRSLNAVLTEQGRAGVRLADVRNMVGDGAARLVERGFADTGAAVDPAALPGLVERFLHHYAAGKHAMTTAFPGVAEALAELAEAGCRLGVCTNKPYRPTLEILDLIGLAGRFGAVTGGDSLAVRKPHPGHLLATVDMLGGRPDDAVMVGDSANDVAMARAAGVSVVAVTWGYSQIPAKDLGADAVIEDFRALAALVGLPAAAGATT